MEGTMYKLLMKTVVAVSAVYVANTFGIETKKGSCQSIDLWHRHLCHLNPDMIKKMATTNLVSSLVLSNKTHSLGFCVGCAFGKSHRNPFPWKKDCQQATWTGDLTHSDVCRPISVATVGGSIYFVLFKNDHTYFRVLFCMKRKSEVISCLKKYFFQLKWETYQSIRILCFDRGGDYNSNDLRTTYVPRKNGISQELTYVYTPE